MPPPEPTNLMRKAAAALFPDSEDEQAAFLGSLLEPEPRGNALVWTGARRDSGIATVDRSSLPDWLPDHIDLARPGEKPGKSPAFREGSLYSMDYSSVLTGSALLALTGEGPGIATVLDLCAAPGGKSVLASTLLEPGLLVSNEIEGRRLGMLRHNLARCRIPNSFTQKLPPERWAELAPERFDLCLVDAPCSGQSLLAKGTDHPGCFHPAAVKGNARRQRRIVESAARTVRPGGYLFYSTCTFSERENEGVVRKFLSREEGWSAQPVPHLAGYRSPHSSFPSYRVYPHLSRGAGGFVCLLRREGEPPPESVLPPPELLAYPVEPAAAEAEDTSSGP